MKTYTFRSIWDESYPYPCYKRIGANERMEEAHYEVSEENLNDEERGLIEGNSYYIRGDQLRLLKIGFDAGKEHDSFKDFLSVYDDRIYYKKDMNIEEQDDKTIQDGGNVNGGEESASTETQTTEETSEEDDEEEEEEEETEEELGLVD